MTILMLSPFWPCCPFKLISCLLLACPSHSLSTTSLFTATKCCRLILYFPSPGPGMSYFFKELWLLLVENGFKSHDLAPRCPHCSRPSCRHLENRCGICVCPSTHTQCIFICLLKAVSLYR